MDAKSLAALLKIFQNVLCKMFVLHHCRFITFWSVTLSYGSKGENNRTHADVLIRTVGNFRRTRMSADPGCCKFEANGMVARYLGQLRTRGKSLRDLRVRPRTSRGYSDRVYWSSPEKVTGCIFTQVRLAWILRPIKKRFVRGFLFDFIFNARDCSNNIFLSSRESPSNWLVCRESRVMKEAAY